MPAAARIGDLHVCAYHRGGEIISGCETVLIGEKPAARVLDVARCVGPDEDGIEQGCETVFIGCQRAARVFDGTNGGYLTTGDATVLIGPSSSPREIKQAIRALRRKRASA